MAAAGWFGPLVESAYADRRLWPVVGDWFRDQGRDDLAEAISQVVRWCLLPGRFGNDPDLAWLGVAITRQAGWCLSIHRHPSEDMRIDFAECLAGWIGMATDPEGKTVIVYPSLADAVEAAAHAWLRFVAKQGGPQAVGEIPF